MRIRSTLFAALALLAIGTAACGNDDDATTASSSKEATTTTTEAASPELCKAAADAGDAVQPLLALDPATATIADIQKALPAVKDAATRARAAAGKQLADRATALEGAEADLEKVLTDAGPTTKLEDAAPGPQSGLARVGNAASLLADEAGCS